MPSHITALGERMAKKQVPAKKAGKPKSVATKTANRATPSQVAPKKTATKGPTATKKAVPSRKSPAKSLPAAAKKAGAAKTVSAKPIAPTKSGPGMKTMGATKDLAVVSRSGDLGDRISDIVQDWAKAASEPPSDAVLSTLWADSGTAAPFTVGAQELTTRLNKELGSKLRPTDITTSTSLSDLIQMIV
jgi:hypothetical protein